MTTATKNKETENKEKTKSDKDIVRDNIKKMLKDQIDKMRELEKQPMPVVTNEDFFEISIRLQDKHVLFYKFWELGKPEFTRRIPTACVTFDREGFNTGFMFNPEFWTISDNYTRDFIICHEMLHVVLNHGARVKDSKTPQITNVALDLVINHLLIRKFGFQRHRIQNADMYCWIDTVFAHRKKEDHPSDDKAFEHYYRLLVEDIKDKKIRKGKKGRGGGGGGGEKGEGEGGEGEGEENYDLPELVDVHDNLDNEDLEDIVSDLNEYLTDEEKSDLRETIENHYQDGEDKEEGGKDSKKGGKEAGKGAGGWTFTNVDSKKVKKKKKWETVIRNWALPFLKSDITDVEQWAREHRRLAGFDCTGIYLPSEMDVEDMHEDKKIIDVLFFMDTSGSCIGLKDRFWKAASSLPEDKFKVRLFNFDTQIYETSLDSRKIYGGGGTSFSILDKKVEHIIKEDGLKRYPTVFVMTDGYGDKVNPKEARNWYWFLSENNTSCIPKECRTFNLKDFE